MCIYCQREFSKYAGMRSHQRKAPLTEYFKEQRRNIERSKKHRWGEVETNRMAILEVKLMSKGKRFINMELVSLEITRIYKRKTEES